MTRETAIRRLTNRWNEQAERFPLMRDTVTLALYLRCNLPGMLRDPILPNGNERLAGYDQ